MKQLREHQNRTGNRGQVLPMMAIFLAVIILFAALAVDLGYAYVTRANLSKAVDAAALAGMAVLSQGQSQAQAVALSTFSANYKSSAGGRDTAMPAPQVTFTTNAQGFTQINVNASTTINTFFARMMPQFKTLTVGSSAQSTRANVALTLVLDRSGSMASNGGSQALPSAVSDFLAMFSDTLDQGALTSFASDATTDVTMRHNFISAINGVVTGWGAGGFTGATFALGGMTLAQAQENNVSDANLQKVIVFFTDGIANTLQDTFKNCPGNKTYNYGGYDAGTSVGFFNPTNGSQYCSINDGDNANCAGCNVSQFFSQQYNKSENFTRLNITNEAEYRMLTLASTMRSANPPVLIYAVGLGKVPNFDFLQQLANDPHSAAANASQPQGIAYWAKDCPGSNCSSELHEAFQTIARDILLRLTR